MQARPGRLVAWLALAAYALCGMLSAKGLVLCFEADGHVALELASDCSDCCSDPGTSEEDPAASMSACACLDVAFSGLDGIRNESKTKQVDLASTRANFGFSAIPAPRSASIRLERWPRSHASVALALVRCTVLRV